MATFISDNQKFHIFSKSPVRANMELFQATNKSGHTVISEEVRTDDIPWFINVPDVNNPPSYVKDPRKNDIIFQGKFNSLSTAAVCKRWDGEKWVDGPNLKENPILKNENDDDVIQVHFENDIEYVSDTNNAGTTSDKQSAFVLKTNGEMLTHFVSPTDKIYNGIPSNGYGLYLFLDNQLQSETDNNDNGYIANSYAGIIQFNKARSESASKFKVITFEYIGGYLSKSLNKIEEDLKDYIDEEIKEHNKEFIAHKNNENAEKHLSQSEVDGLNTLTSSNKISGIETATQYDYQAEADLSKALSAEITTPNASDSTFKNVTIKLHLRDKVLQQSTMPVTSKAIYNHVHKQSVNIEKASNNVTVEEVTTNENERRKYTIAVDGYTTSETDSIVDDIHEKIQATTDDINKNVAEHTSNNEIHITDTERVSWNNNEVVLQKHLNAPNMHVSDEDREKWDNANNHTSDNIIHITADERSKWNTASQKIIAHENNNDIHVSNNDRELWNKGGNLTISGDNFITPEKTDTGWSLTLNNSTDISSSDIDGDKKVPTVNAIHNALYGYETTVVPQTYNTVWDNITAGTQVANTGGFYFSVDQTTTCNAIEIRQIVNNGNTAFSSAYIKIWNKATGSLLSKSPTKTTLSGGEGDTWDIDEMTFSPGIEYLITFNDNNTSSQFSTGYSVRFDKMASNLGAGYGLLNSGTLNAAHEGICPKVILKTLIPESTTITKVIPEGLYDKHQTHINDTFIHNNAIVDGLYDKTDNVVSYQEGLITYTDGTTEFKDISDSISAQAAFRTSSGITPNLISFNTRPELVNENGEPTSNRWYDNNYATEFDYEMDANAHSVAVNELSSLGSLVNGSWMFTRSGLTMFNDDINCLTNGTAMFFNSKNLSRFKSALPSLTVGQWMFKGCNLKEFKSKMPALSIAQGMFAANENLITFNSLMPNLTVGVDMFLNCSKLTTFIVPPSSLKNLYYSRAMFKGCSNLNIFTGSLEALEQPYWMFNNCKLSLESIRNIANTVKDYTGIYQDDLTHAFGPIGIDCLANEYDNSEFKPLIDKIRGKGWSLELQFNKSTQTLNLDEPGNAPTNILYVKKENLGETLNEYIDENLNTWALTYANKVYDLEGWTIFSSVEEAAEAWKLTPVSR